MIAGQKVYICQGSLRSGGVHRELAVVERVTESFAVVNGAKFRLRATKGQTVRRGWHSYQEGVKPALSEINGDRYIEDALTRDRADLRSSIFRQIKALEKRLASKDHDIETLANIYKYLHESLITL
jgi:hypothetical protein